MPLDVVKSPGMPLTRPPASEGPSLLGRHGALLASGQTWFDRREPFVIDDSTTYLQTQQSGPAPAAVWVHVWGRACVHECLIRDGEWKLSHNCKWAHLSRRGLAGLGVEVCAAVAGALFVVSPLHAASLTKARNHRFLWAVAVISTEKCRPFLDTPLLLLLWLLLFFFGS